MTWKLKIAIARHKNGEGKKTAFVISKMLLGRYTVSTTAIRQVQPTLGISSSQVSQRHIQSASWPRTSREHTSKHPLDENVNRGRSLQTWITCSSADLTVMRRWP